MEYQIKQQARGNKRKKKSFKQFADQFLQNNKEKRLWYFERCYRYERPQSGRYSNFKKK